MLSTYTLWYARNNTKKAPYYVGTYLVPTINIIIISRYTSFVCLGENILGIV